jgi:GntR family transcriptional regulator of arabinose operon
MMLDIDVQIEKPLPSYAQLVDAMKSAIARRTLAPGSRLPDERELARQFGLSRGTVRRALAELEGAGLLMRQQGRGTFVADERDTPAIPLAAIVSDAGLTSGPGFVGQVVQAMAGASAANGAQLLLRDLKSSEARSFVEPAAEIFTCVLDSKLIKAAARKRPVVSVDYIVKGARVDSVLYDNRAGARDAVHHLIAAGHRRIACIDAKLERRGKLLDEPTSLDRTAGYCDAMSEAGLQTVVWAMPLETRDVRREIARHFKGVSRPTALFAFDDAIALGVWMGLTEMGLRIPRDLSIACFRCSDAPSPGGIDWTSVSVSAADLGKTAVEAALHRINNPQSDKETENGRTIVVPHKWLAGETCVPPHQ